MNSLSWASLLYNPDAGRRPSENLVNIITEFYRDSGMEVRPFCAKGGIGWEEFFQNPSGCSSVLVAGGDGSLNRAVNLMIQHRLDIPIGVIPAGTVNDYAHYLNIPSPIMDCMRTFLTGTKCRSDVGVVNGQHFINVCGVGLFTNGSTNYSIDLKHKLGKMAYYLQCIGNLPKMKSCKLRITTRDKVIEDNFYILLAMNGTSAGGFKNLAKYAQNDDELLEIIGIKAISPIEIPPLLNKILKGTHLENDSILYLQTDKLTIESLEENNYAFEFSDLDGDKGPRLPIEISIKPKMLSFISGSTTYISPDEEISS